jgi:DNA-binding transcriptional MerR regulator
MNDPLYDIRHYSPTMTISQVLKFCEKKGLDISRAMIQNYIRDGLLPPPVKKRLYTHKHLAALVMIVHLKAVFDMPVIHKVLGPYIDDEGLPLEIYSNLFEKLHILTQEWEGLVSRVLANEDAGTLLTMCFTAGLKLRVIIND